MILLFLLIFVVFVVMCFFVLSSARRVCFYEFARAILCFSFASSLDFNNLIIFFLFLSCFLSYLMCKVCELCVLLCL